MRIKFLFLFLVLMLIALGIAIFLWGEGVKPLHLYLLEGGVVLILLYLIPFHRKIVKPMNTIGNGMDLLREQDFSSRLSPVGQVDADRVVNVFNRMMDQLKFERVRLREQNQFLDLLINASPMGVIILTFDRDVQQMNPMAMKMLGMADEDEFFGKQLTQLSSPLAGELASLPRGEAKVLRLNDANIYKCVHSSFVDHGFPHPFYLLEPMTDEVMKAEKRAYEKVIRMIAHEVNNTTAGITSTLDTVGQALAEEPGMVDVCDVMRVCIERCFSMSRFITRFADVVKIPEPTPVNFSLNEMATTCKRFMEGMCQDLGISLRLECSEEVSEAKLDASLFEQVLVNVIKNAAESIDASQRRDGEIVVRTLPPAIIEVEDNGQGISRETSEKLFTPFFSTKPNGQGIGLVFIREVLSRHDCTFSLRTCEDGKTRFRISF